MNEGSASSAAPGRARRLLRIAAWAVAVLVLLAIALVVAVRTLLFPALAQRVDAVADALSRAVGQRVEIGAVSGRWDGPRIQVDLERARIVGDDGATRVDLPGVEATLSWRSLLLGRPSLKTVTLRGAALEIRRSRDGEIYVGGYVLPALRAGGGPSAPTLDAFAALDHIDIEGAVLTWSDELRGAPPLVVSGVNLRIAGTAGSYAVTASAAPPPALGASLSLDARVRFAEFAIASASGTATATVKGADLAAWKPWIEYPIDVQSGRGDVVLTAVLDRGSVRSLDLDASLAAVDMQLDPGLARLELATLAGKLAVGPPDARGVRRVTARDIGLRPAAPADSTSIGPIGFDIGVPFDGEGDTRFSIAALDLALADRIAAAVPLPADARRLLDEARPRGRIDSAEVRIAGPLSSPRSYSIDAKVAGLKVQRIGALPEVRDVTGTIGLHPDGGSVQLTGARLAEVQIPGLPERVSVDALVGGAKWTTGSTGTRVTLEGFSVATRDFAATLTGSAASDASSQWRADLNATVERLEGSQLVRYLPGLGRDAAQWMKRALVRMPLANGRVRFEGRVADFPFARPGSGVFEASGRISRGQLAYAPGWPALEDIDATIALAGVNLRVDLARAKLSGMDVTGARADIANLLAASGARLDLDGRLAGPLAGVLRFLKESPLRAVTGKVLDEWSAEGPSQVAVKLAIPLDAPDQVKHAVTVDFLGNRLLTGLIGREPVTDLRGQLRVDGSQFSAQGLQARAFGGPFTTSIASAAGGGISIDTAGAADFGALARWLEVPAPMSPSGEAAYRIQATGDGVVKTFRFESDLKGVTLPLPEPLGKPADVAWPSRVALAGDLLDVAIGPAISAKLRLRRGGGRTALERGTVLIGGGQAALPASPGLDVTARASSLNLDPLLAWWRKSSTGLGTSSDSQQMLTAARIVTPELTLADRRFRDVDVTVRKDGAQRWQAQIQSREIAGRASYAPAGRGAVTARLQRLTVPPALNAAAAAPADAGALPALDLQADRFAMGGRDFGRLELLASNAGAEWRLQRLALTLPHCRLDATGANAPAQGRASGRSSLDFNARFDDIGLCLTELGRPAEVAGGQGNLGGAIAWNGSMTDFDVASLSGSLQVTARNGRFLQVRQGVAGTLLSVLSLRALGNIATLSFRSTFSEGFQFTQVQGTARIDNGVLSTTDFAMQGPAAGVAMAGTVDLRDETQNLNVRVAPALGNAISTGLTIVNPVLGAGAFLANRLFRGDIPNVVTFDYRITGTFSAPVVESGGIR